MGASVHASLEAGRITGSSIGPRKGTLYAGSIFLGASTFLGPAFLGLGYGEGGRTSVYLLLGIP